MLSRFIRVVAYGTISFFLWLNNIPLYKWMSRFLSSFMDAWIISTSWLLWVVLQWTRKCRHLFRTEISVSSAVCTEEGLTCHMAAPLQVFEKPPHCSPWRRRQFTLPAAALEGSLFSASIVILVTSCLWQWPFWQVCLVSHWGLVCVSLMIGGGEHLSVCLLVWMASYFYLSSSLRMSVTFC